MPHRWSRRQVVQGAGTAGLGLLAGCGRWPGQAAPPPAAKVHRIAFLAGTPPSAEQAVLVSAFRQGLRDLGYIEGENLLLAERNASDPDQVAAPAAELVRLQPEVVLVPSVTVARAVQAQSVTIPIVSTGTGTGDLVADGLATSHARPGGMVTGLSRPSSLVGKQLQLLQEMAPTLSRVAVLFNATIPPPRDPYEAAARTLGLQLQFVGVAGPEDLERVVGTATREHADGLLLSTGSVISNNQTWIAELALQSRLPSMWQQSDAVGRGGLMAYGPNRAAQFRRAAYYVDRILKGTQPADLPIEEPTTFDFVINLRTAQTLGLTIPPHVLLQATEVIQ
jgi:putative tryptophan/tyrosine transport system substrate-binding protein